MDFFQLLCIVLGIIVVLQFVLFAFVNNKYSKLLKAQSDREVGNVSIKGGTRYTVDQTVENEFGEVNISLSTKDIILEQNKTYVAGKNLAVKPGKYTVLATAENVDTFNLRIGTYVRSYSHAESIVLHEGEQITALSTSVILR